MELINIFNDKIENPLYEPKDKRNICGENCYKLLTKNKIIEVNLRLFLKIKNEFKIFSKKKS